MFLSNIPEAFAAVAGYALFADASGRTVAGFALSAGISVLS